MIAKLAKMQYRFLDRMRHREAFRAAREQPTAGDFEPLHGHHYCLLVSFRRSGEPVPTPVLFGLRDGKLYFRTEAGVAKLARIGNEPAVRVAPCNWRGKPLGPLAQGSARPLPAGEAADAAYAVLKESYTFGDRLFEGMIDRLPIDIVYVEVVPAAVDLTASR
jgi:PPOX class probable F420-dependent enzyme